MPNTNIPADRGSRRGRPSADSTMGSVGHREAARLLPRAAAVRGPHAAVEGEAFLLEAVEGGAAPRRDALEGGLDGQVEEVRPVRVAAAPRAVERVDLFSPRPRPAPW